MATSPNDASIAQARGLYAGITLLNQLEPRVIPDRQISKSLTSDGFGNWIV